LTFTDRKSPGLFITGTDTGVGKTIVTAAIATAFKVCGIDAGVMKPIATGLAENSTRLSDPDWLMSVTGVQDSSDLIAPYRFLIPAAPLVAAAQTGRPIDPMRILEALQTLLPKHDCVVVEGIGGVLVPITPGLFVADLIKQLNLPALVVARTGLGSINHTLLTLECLRNRGVPLLGLIFNRPAHPATDADLSETVPTIRQLSGLRTFGELPYCEGLPATWEKHRDTLISRLDVQNLLEALGLRGLA
jgi:dethiobiotin synthetase